MNDNELRILEELAISSDRELSFTKIQFDTTISPRFVTTYLEKLTKNKFVKETGRDNWRRGKKLLYSITPLGRAALEQELVFKRTSHNPNATEIFKVRNTIVKTLGQNRYLGQTKIETAFNRSRLGDVPVQVFLWNSFEEGGKAKIVLDSLNKNGALELFTSRFIDELKRSNIEAENAKHEQNWTTEPFQLQELIKQERTALDTDTMLLIHFNGKKIVRETDWDKELKAVEKGDELLREGWELFKKAISKPGIEQQNWVRDETIEKIHATERIHLPKFLAQSLGMDDLQMQEVEQNEWTTLNNPSKLMENYVEKLTKEICISVKHDEKGKPHLSKLPEKEIQQTRLEVKKKH